MKISELSIRNFRGIGEIDFKIKINQNLNILLLIGPNGYGKSSFFDAIEWAFTGKINRITNLGEADKKRFKTGTFINFYNINDVLKNYKRKAKVDLKFSNGYSLKRINNVYSLTNTSDYKEGIPSFFDENNSLINDEKFYRHFIAEEYIDKLDFDEQFYYSHILGQDTINDFIRGYKGEERQKKIYEILGMKNFSTLIEMVNPKKGELNKLKIMRKNLETEKNELEDQIKTLEDALNNYLEKCNLKNLDELIENVKFKVNQLIPLLKEHNIIITNEIIEKLGENKGEAIIDLKKELESIAFNLSNNIKSIYDKYCGLKSYKNNLQLIELLILLKDLNSKVVNMKYFSENFNNIKYSLVEEKIKNAYTKNRNIVINRIEAITNIIDYWINVLNEFELSISTESLIRFRYFKLKAHKQISQIKNVDKQKKYFYFYSVIDGFTKDYKNTLKDFLKEEDEYNRLLKEYENSSNLNQAYKDYLVIQKEFIINNRDFINEQKKCPLCTQGLEGKINISYNLEESTLPADKLLEIINYILISGDSVMQVKKNNIDHKKLILNQKKMSVENLIRNISDNFHVIKESLLSDNDLILKRKNKIITSINEKEKQYNSKCQSEKAKYDKIKDIKEDLFKDSSLETLTMEELDNMNRILENDFFRIKEKIEKKGLSLVDFKNSVMIQNKINELTEINNSFNFNKVKIDEIDQILFKYESDINIMQSIQKNIEEIKKEFFPEDFKDEILNISKKKEEFIKVKSKYEKADDTLEKLSKLTNRIKNKIMDINQNYIEKNKLVCSLYEAINPHPFYRNLVLKSRNDGVEFMCEEMMSYNSIEDRFFLDYIFSSAQTNVLALSIFLGFALQQKWSKLEQIFIDDPIQNMDDINILSFIDVLRSLFLDEGFKKQIIISTHDDKLAELLRRKFRFLNLEIIKFESYTEEGPIIKHFDRDLQLINY